jgi:hypothetical protein
VRDLDPIDHLLSLDLSRRGIARFFVPGGALAAARALTRARRVLITTGFTLGNGVPETDGPPGAVALGAALARRGADVLYVTDAVNVPLIAACQKTLDAPAEILLYGADTDAADILARARASHLIAVERPGRTARGEYLSMRGESVAAWNRPLDELFVRRRGRTPVTIGVGDGGNEIGMGNVRARVGRVSALMKRTACAVRVDHLVVAPVSNWGAYAIVAGLSRLTREALLHGPDVERALIAACVGAGAQDGITRRREATVDALPADVHAAVVELLGRCMMDSASAPPRGERKVSPR